MSVPSPVAALARVMLALMFVMAGASKFANLEGTAGYIASGGLPMPAVLAVLTAALELLGGLALALGFQARFAALALAVFTVVASLLFHKFWAVPAEQVMMQKMSFFKNIAIAGGLYAFAAFGPGAWSVDAKTGNAA